MPVPNLPRDATSLTLLVGRMREWAHQALWQGGDFCFVVQGFFWDTPEIIWSSGAPALINQPRNATIIGVLAVWSSDYAMLPFGIYPDDIEVIAQRAIREFARVGLG